MYFCATCSCNFVKSLSRKYLGKRLIVFTYFCLGIEGTRDPGGVLKSGAEMTGIVIGAMITDARDPATDGVTCAQNWITGE